MSELAAFTWAGLRLYVLDDDTDLGRDVVQLQPARGSRYINQDRGSRPGVCKLSVIFTFIAAETSDYVDRYKAFRAIRDIGTAQVFVHPLHGSYRARIGEFNVHRRWDAEAITVDVEFIPEESLPGIDDTIGAAPIAGPEAVLVAAARAGREVVDLGTSEELAIPYPSMLPTLDADGNVATDENGEQVQGDLTDTATEWAEAEAPASSDVALQLASHLAEIDAYIEDNDLVNLETWQLYVELITLRAALTESAESVVSATERVLTIVVRVAAPLLMLIARELGASDARAREAEVQRLNPGVNPAMVPAGTTIRMPAVQGRARRTV